MTTILNQKKQQKGKNKQKSTWDSETEYKHVKMWAPFYAQTHNVWCRPSVKIRSG